MTPTNNLSQWLYSLLTVGGAVWGVGLVMQNEPSPFTAQAELLLLFGVGMITPLALYLAAQPNRLGQHSRLYYTCLMLHPASVIGVGVALWLESGWLATLGALLWLLQTSLLAAYGLFRFVQRPAWVQEETLIDAGLVYSMVSGIWLVAYAAGYSLFTFERSLVLLTAVHFVFISLGALVIVGMAGRWLYGTPVWRSYQWISSLLIVSPILVAIGITATQFTGRLLLEGVAVVVLVSSLWALAAIFLTRKTPHLLLWVSAGSAVFTMSLALGYLVGRATGWWSLSLVEMVQWHGWINALGFTFGGLVGWSLSPQTTHHSQTGILFSQLRGKGRIGTDFFQRMG